MHKCSCFSDRLVNLFSMRVMEEENGNMVAHKKGTHAGYDRFSMPPKTEDILEEARSCGIPAGKG